MESIQSKHTANTIRATRERTGAMEQDARTVRATPPYPAYDATPSRVVDPGAAVDHDPAEAKPMLFSPSHAAPDARTRSLRATNGPFARALRQSGPEGGCNDMKPFRIGPVSIQPEGVDRWLIRYIDPGSGKDVRRKLSGLSRKEIEVVALNLNKEFLVQGGYLPGAKPRLPSIAEGIAEAIELRNTIASTTQDRARRASLFVRWLAERHPGVTSWDQLRPAMVQAYAVHLEREGRAADTIRLNLAPIKLAWRHMAENHPDEVRPLPRIRVSVRPPREIECLEAGEVAELLDWLRDHATDLWPIACLQGLAGLRMLEAGALRRKDVDLERGLVTIADTGSHKPKTRDSYRTIPLCREALEALRFAVENRRLVPPTDELFVNRAWNIWCKDALSLRWGRNLRAAAKARSPRLAEVPARKLRAAFATMASRLGAPDRALKAYLGHSPGDMLGSHYRRIDPVELRTVSSLMDGWRNFARPEVAGTFPASECVADA